MPNTIGVINYEGGNIQSIINVLDLLGYQGKIISHLSEFKDFDKLIFPGVGSFGHCMKVLNDKKLKDPIHDWLKNDMPFLGICLGYQVLFEISEESPEIDGIGFFKGDVVKFNKSKSIKIPHMGWNNVEICNKNNKIWDSIESSSYFYFVHSYYPKPKESYLISSKTLYDIGFASSVSSGNIFACQFHPERSQKLGINLINNFLTKV